MQTQSVLVKGVVQNPRGALRSSQFVRARIIWKTAQGLVVPVTAVLRINGQYFVFVAEGADGKLVAHQRGVKVGPIVGDDYPVLEGVKAGERWSSPARRSWSTARQSQAAPDDASAQIQPAASPEPPELPSQLCSREPWS